MGSGSHRGTSHSAMSDMETINQETPTMGGGRTSFDRYASKGSSGGNNRSDDREYDEDFEIVRHGGGSGSSSGPPRYESAFTGGAGGGGGGGSRSDYSSSSRANRSTWDTSEDVATTVQSISSSDRGGFSSVGGGSGGGEEKSRSRKAFDVSDTNDAQKKFGNAKAISSDAYFGTERDMDFETKQNLRKYEGSSSISSAELFGNGSTGRNGGGGGGGGGRSEYNGNTGSDLSDIKEGVRQGVTKVAGRLSSLANGVMTSLQDNYG